MFFIKDVKIIADKRQWCFPNEKELIYLWKALDLLKVFDEALKAFQTDGVTISQLFFRLRIINEYLDSFKVIFYDFLNFIK